MEEILKKENIIQDKKNVDYKGLIGRWTELRILRESWKRELLNEEGKTTEDFKKDLDDKWKMDLFAPKTPLVRSITIPKVSSESNPEISETDAESPLFSEIIPVYLEFMTRNKRRQTSIDETEVTYQDFIQILGDRPVSDYTRNDARDYRNAISRLPRNRSKLKD